MSGPGVWKYLDSVTRGWKPWGLEAEGGVTWDSCQVKELGSEYPYKANLCLLMALFH